jgi:hypothetical protein
MNYPEEINVAAILAAWSENETADWLNSNPLPSNFEWYMIKRIGETSDLVRSPLPDVGIRYDERTREGYGSWLRRSFRHLGLFEECHFVLVNWDGPRELPETGAELAEKLSERVNCFAQSPEGLSGECFHHLSGLFDVEVTGRRLLTGNPSPWVERMRVERLVENDRLVYCRSLDRDPYARRATPPKRVFVRVASNENFTVGMEFDACVRDRAFLFFNRPGGSPETVGRLPVKKGVW